MECRKLAVFILTATLAACAAPAHRSDVSGTMDHGGMTHTGTMPAMAMAMPGGGHVHMPYLTARQVQDRYRLEADTDPSPPIAGRETRVTVHILDSSGAPVTTLQVHHERLAHFLVVSENLEEFHHVHPEDFGLLTEEARRAGRFQFPVTFGSGGRYALALDFVDQGHAAHADLDLRAEGPPQAPTRWNLGRDRTDGALTARLVTNPPQPTAGVPMVGIFHLATSAGPVDDLEPYLGALLHLAIFREGATVSAHEHGGGPEFANFADVVPTPGYRGPKVYFEHTFDQAGRYRLFAQFQRNGQVVTVPFDLEVTAARGR